MATDILTLRNVADKVNRHVERLLMTQELMRLTVKSLPDNTDSDVPLALLNGIQAMLSADTDDMQLLCESLDIQAGIEVVVHA
ncbi:MAG: hypothetical protein Q8L62_05900 [Candidatus Nitrotoga sp.]|nr:hypothetical protein [Candidatus Nitrotoga sp.]